MDNISILDKKNCTGCRMCEQICPKNAVTIGEDYEGFFVPIIDKEKCIDCGLCYKKCPQINNIKFNNINGKKVYAAKIKDRKEQKTSSSGGVFISLAKYILENNGVVVGCSFDNLEANHIAIYNEENLNKLKGSKYVQSNTKGTFSEVKKALDNEKFVLYTGTPCQIAGLKQFLGKEYEKLITIDLLCHGVPSPRLFKKYINYLEKKYNDKVENYEFRNKEKEYWGLGYKIKVNFSKSVKYINEYEDIYMNAFSKGLTLRESCYTCKYASENRTGDMTIGDFWGIEKEYPKLYDKEGVSVVIINTDKGKEIFEKIKDYICFQQVEYEKVKKYADTLKQCCERPNIRETIYKEIEDKGIDEVLKIKKNVKILLKKYVPSVIKLKIKEIKK